MTTTAPTTETETHSDELCEWCNRAPATITLTYHPTVEESHVCQDCWDQEQEQA